MKNLFQYIKNVFRSSLKRFKSVIAVFKRLFLLLRLGFNLFNSESKNKEYYETQLHKWFSIYKNIPYYDEKSIKEKIKNDISYFDTSGLFFSFKTLFNIINKDKVFKLYKTLGLLCLVIAMSSFPLSPFYTNIVNSIAGSYVIYNFLYLFTSIICLFSRYFYIFRNRFEIVRLFNNIEKFAFSLGYFLHFCWDFFLAVIQILLQCYIVDLYYQKFTDSKFFDLDQIINKFCSKNSTNFLQTLFISFFSYIWIKRLVLILIQIFFGF